MIRPDQIPESIRPMSPDQLRIVWLTCVDETLSASRAELYPPEGTTPQCRAARLHQARICEAVAAEAYCVARMLVELGSRKAA